MAYGDEQMPGLYSLLSGLGGPFGGGGGARDAAVGPTPMGGMFGNSGMFGGQQGGQGRPNYGLANAGMQMMGAAPVAPPDIGAATPREENEDIAINRRLGRPADAQVSDDERMQYRMSKRGPGLAKAGMTMMRAPQPMATPGLQMGRQRYG